jgi:hypothetical protein
VLGALQLVSGGAYLVAFVVRLLSPEAFAAISRSLMPLYLGELGMVLWLFIMGARVPRTGAGAAAPG